MKYDPMVGPSSEKWLQIDELERINVIEDFHRASKVELPNEKAHAIIHAIVENQVAMKVPAVLDALARLRAEGLDRHESVHAVGTVLAETLHALMSKQVKAVPAVTNDMYAEALKKLTVSWWRNNYGQSPKGRRR